MAKTWDKNLKRFVNRHEGRTTLNAITQRDIPKGELAFWSKYNNVRDNPNLDFRIRIYEPLRQRAQLLVKTYGNDFEGLRQRVQGESYNNLVELAIGAGKDIHTPGAVGFLKPGTGGGFLDAMEGIGKLSGTAGRNLEWRMSGDERKMQIAFWLQIDQLVDTLAGKGGNELMVGNILREEASRQMEWDSIIAKIPKDVLKEAMGENKIPRYPTMSQNNIEGSGAVLVPQKAADELPNNLLLDNSAPWEPAPQSRNIEKSESPVPISTEGELNNFQLLFQEPMSLNAENGLEELASADQYVEPAAELCDAEIINSPSVWTEMADEQADNEQSSPAAFFNNIITPGEDDPEAKPLVETWLDDEQKDISPDSHNAGIGEDDSGDTDVEPSHANSWGDDETDNAASNTVFTENGTELSNDDLLDDTPPEQPLPQSMNNTEYGHDETSGPDFDEQDDMR